MNKWITHQLSDDYEKRIREAIRKVERGTSAEIVPMIVRSSGPTGHVGVIVFLVTLVLGLALDPFIPYDHIYPLLPWHWTLLYFVAAFVLARVAPRWGWLCNRLTRREDLAQQVRLRALLEFHESQVQHTLSKTGVLLFLSLRERQAVVLADKTIATRVDQKVWDEVISELIKGAHEKSLVEGVVLAIEACGRVLTPLFPRAKTDLNEIEDKLIVKE